MFIEFLYLWEGCLDNENNSTNINKTSNHLSPSPTEHKRKPQQRTLPVTFTYWTQEKTTTKDITCHLHLLNTRENHNKGHYLSPSPTEHKRKPQQRTLEIQVLIWDRHQKQQCGGIKPVNGTPIPLFITGSPMAIHI